MESRERHPCIEIIDEQSAEMYRNMTPAQRARLGFQARDFAERAIEAGVRHAHRDWSDAQVTAEVRVRMTRGSG